jgi:hypothetical protein
MSARGVFIVLARSLDRRVVEVVAAHVQGAPRPVWVLEEPSFLLEVRDETYRLVTSAPLTEGPRAGESAEELGQRLRSMGWRQGPVRGSPSKLIESLSERVAPNPVITPRSRALLEAALGAPVPDAALEAAERPPYVAEWTTRGG